MSYGYIEMTPEEFERAVVKMPLFLMPMGLIEWHADHLPLGLDGIKAAGLCERIAQRMGGGIVLPPTFVGRPGFSTYAGTLTYSESLVNQTIYETLYQLKKVGARVVVILTGHYGNLQVDCVKRAAHCFAVENPSIKVIAQAEYEGVLVNGEEPADHAGKWETSMFWRMFPDLTHFEKLNMNPMPRRYLDPPNYYYKDSPNWEWWDDVENSSPELGEKAIQAITEHFAALILKAFEELNIRFT
ncbi:MAG: creatininase family protein [Bacillota bacterium]